MMIIVIGNFDLILFLTEGKLRAYRHQTRILDALIRPLLLTLVFLCLRGYRQNEHFANPIKTPMGDFVGRKNNRCCW